MSTTEIGIRFEKYVQSLLESEGYNVRRNVLYHKKGRRRQVDLEYRSGLVFRKHTIVECKYVCSGRSVRFYDSYVQLGEAMLFTGADEGILVTPVEVSKRKQKEKEYMIRIYDRSWFRKRTKGQNLERMIRSAHYDAAKDHSFIHRHL